MFFPQAEDSLFVHKGILLLFGILCLLNFSVKLLWPDGSSVAVDDVAGLLIGLVALALFWWLHQRVRRVTAGELGMQIMSEPVEVVIWSEISSVQKALPTLLSGFYLISLTDGTKFYTPIEREPPRFSTLMTWYEASTSLEQICRKKGVWVQ